jgi:hypothetical protein
MAAPLFFFKQWKLPVFPGSDKVERQSCRRWQVAFADTKI